MALVRRFARPMMSSMFITGGINCAQECRTLAKRAEPVTDKLEPAVDKATEPLPFALDAKQMVQLNGIIHVIAYVPCAATSSSRWAASLRRPTDSVAGSCASREPPAAAGHS